MECDCFDNLENILITFYVRTFYCIYSLFLQNFGVQKDLTFFTFIPQYVNIFCKRTHDGMNWNFFKFWMNIQNLKAVWMLLNEFLLKSKILNANKMSVKYINLPNPYQILVQIWSRMYLHKTRVCWWVFLECLLRDI